MFARQKAQCSNKINTLLAFDAQLLNKRLQKRNVRSESARSSIIFLRALAAETGVSVKIYPENIGVRALAFRNHTEQRVRHSRSKLWEISQSVSTLLQRMQLLF